jgi:hypothetical protein
LPLPRTMFTRFVIAMRVRRRKGDTVF